MTVVLQTFFAETKGGKGEKSPSKLGRTCLLFKSVETIIYFLIWMYSSIIYSPSFAGYFVRVSSIFLLLRSERLLFLISQKKVRGLLEDAKKMGTSTVEVSRTRKTRVRKGLVYFVVKASNRKWLLSCDRWLWNWAVNQLKTQPTFSAIHRKTACINRYVKLNA